MIISTIYIAWFEYVYVEYARFVWLILKLNQLMQLIPDKNHLRTTVDYTRRNEITRFWQLLSHLMLLSGRSFMKYISFGIDEHSASNPMQYNVILDISLRISGRRVWQLKKLRTRGLLRAPFCFTVRVRVRVFLYTSKSLSYMGSPQNPQPFQFLSSRYIGDESFVAFI